LSGAPELLQFFGIKLFRISVKSKGSCVLRLAFKMLPNR
jgi:hypothetical protein